MLVAIDEIWERAEQRRDFLSEMKEKLESAEESYGLTPNQHSAVERIIAACRSLGHEGDGNSGRYSGISALLQGLSHRVNNAKVVVKKDDRVVVVSICPATTRSGKPCRWPGHLYIKGGDYYDAPYWGRVDCDGRLYSTVECPDQALSILDEMEVDPIEFIDRYGKLMGRSTITNASLSNWRSVIFGYSAGTARKRKLDYTKKSAKGIVTDLQNGIISVIINRDTDGKFAIVDNETGGVIMTVKTYEEAQDSVDEWSNIMVLEESGELIELSIGVAPADSSAAA